jgi:hypothetical protein
MFYIWWAMCMENKLITKNINFCNNTGQNLGMEGRQLLKIREKKK